jgi:hypothetical protein
MFNQRFWVIFIICAITVFGASYIASNTVGFILQNYPPKKEWSHNYNWEYFFFIILFLVALKIYGKEEEIDRNKYDCWGEKCGTIDDK